ncbi:hypothetical protein [Planococcus sp. YIM B11945]|uniref:hypothetical protein n=1 Tax=Planococcus sp. YIM B11945 TaxID=3435410 RepID=UPI003D7CD1A5
MDTILYFFFGAAYIVLMAWGIRRQKNWSWMSVVFLVVIGLIYDNFIIAIGRFVGEGALLKGLSLPRFWSHALLTPPLALFSWAVLHHAGVAWAKKKVVIIGVLLYTAALIVIEIALETAQLWLTSANEYGALRYVSAEPASGPPIMVLLVTLALIFASIVLWRKTSWKWMLIGAVVMTIGSAVPIPVESAAATNAFELFLLFTLVWTKVRVESRTLTKNSV